MYHKNIKLKIVFSIILTIMCIAGMVNISNAVSFSKVGDTQNIGLQTLVDSTNLYCIQKGGLINRTTRKYKCETIVNINGLTAKNGDRSKTHLTNGVIAYILYHGKDSGFGNAVNNNLDNIKSTKYQLALYATYNNWRTNVLSTIMPNNYKNYGPGNNGKATQTEESKKLTKAANDYANKLNEFNKLSTSITNQNENVQVQKTGEGYIIVGPFNWKYTTSTQYITNTGFTELNVKDQDGNNIKNEYISYGTSLTGTFSNDYNSQISSGKNFYIKINTSESGVSSITNVSAKMKLTFNKIYTAKVCFLRTENKIPGKNYRGQRLLYAEPKVTSKDKTLSINQPIDIEVKQSLKIIKVDSSNESKKLEGVKFLIKYMNVTDSSVTDYTNVETSYIYKKDGKIGYTNQDQIPVLLKDYVSGAITENEEEYIQKLSENSETSSYIFETNIDGTIMESEVEIGTYRPVEIYNPHFGYQKVSDIEWSNSTKKNEVDTIVTTNQASKVTITNSLQTGIIALVKVGIDGETVEELAGVVFSIKCTKSSNKKIDIEGQYVVYDNEQQTYTYIDEKTYNEALEAYKSEKTYRYQVLKTEDDGSLFAPVYPGFYDIEEQYLPPVLEEKYVKDYKVENQEVTTGKPLELPPVENYAKSPGDLIIKKIDKETGKPIEGVKFTVQCIKLDDEQLNLQYEGQYLSYDENQEVIFSEELHEFETDIEGKIELYNINTGKYKIVETENSSENPKYWIEYSEEVTVEEKKQSSTEVTVYNTPIGKLEIQKVDEDTEEPLEGVSFTVKYLEQDPKYKDHYVYLEDGKVKYSSEAHEFVTNAEGKIVIDGLLIGQYQIVETNNPIYGYDAKDVPPQNATVRSDNTVPNVFRITNKRKLINISGKVWEDQAKGKGNTYNNVYDDEELLEGITVVLRGTSLESDPTTKTDKNGSYIFKDILIEDLANAYVEFTYDGFNYTTVKPFNEINGELEISENETFGKLNDQEKDRITSKAKEVADLRNTLNNKFALIDKDGVKNANGYLEGTIEYEYNKEKHESTLTNLNMDCNIKATTTEAKYSLKFQYENKNYIRDEETGALTIPNVNLGLVKRAMPDIAIKSVDLKIVETTVNGYTHTYQYALRNKYKTDEDYNEEDVVFNTGAKFQNKIDQTQYTRTYYTTDVELAEQGKINFETYMTYSINVVNQSGSLLMKANTIADYYDYRYDVEEVKCGEDKLKFTSSNSVDGYSMAKIDVSKYTIKPGEALTIDIKFKLSTDAVKILANKNTTNMVLNNIAEILSYSTYDPNTNSLYAGIDKDSAPGNATPGNKETYEDDTDYAASLKLVVRNADGTDIKRTVSGLVFLDSTSQKINPGEERKGNGIYDNSEQVLENIPVTLKIQIAGTEEWLVYEPVKTGSDGNYTIEGYIPGKAVLEFTWGIDTYKVEDYKSTIFNVRDGFDTDSGQFNDPYWYEKDIARYSDAIDDYNTRQELNSNYNNGQDISQEEMTATTPTFAIGVEYKGSEVIDDEGIKSEYSIEEMDFGIVERPRTNIELSKVITNIDVTLANGQNLVSGDVKEKLKYVRTLEKTDKGSSDVVVEMDSTLIYGSTLKVKYAITVTNNSELDYNTEKYYKYGIIDADPIRTEVKEVVDYLDTKLTVEGATILSKGEIDNKTHIKFKEEAKGYQVIILNFENQDLNLGVGDSATDESIVVSRVLSNSDDDLKYENSAEILEIYNETGRPQAESVPGNYVPGKSISEVSENGEKDSDKATISVVPSTGEDKSTPMQYIIGISLGLVVLAGGVFIIKKKLL